MRRCLAPLTNVRGYRYIPRKKQSLDFSEKSEGQCGTGYLKNRDGGQSAPVPQREIWPVGKKPMLPSMIRNLHQVTHRAFLSEVCRMPFTRYLPVLCAIVLGGSCSS